MLNEVRQYVTHSYKVIDVDVYSDRLSYLWQVVCSMQSTASKRVKLLTYSTVCSGQLASYLQRNDKYVVVGFREQA